MEISTTIIEECKIKLIERKRDLLNRVKLARLEHQQRDNQGDEVDKCVDLLAENQYLISQDRLRLEIFEIEAALSRIENGTFGVCEETEEPIEVDRLLTIPWTRFSIEGAEIKESLNKRYAR